MYSTEHQIQVDSDQYSQNWVAPITNRTRTSHWSGTTQKRDSNHSEYDASPPYNTVESKGKEREPRYEGRYDVDMTTPLSSWRRQDDYATVQTLVPLSCREVDDPEEWHDSEEWLAGASQQ
jgi:hypothetical protein